MMSYSKLWSNVNKADDLSGLVYETDKIRSCLSQFSSPGIDHIAAKLSNQLLPSQTHKLSDDTI